MSGPTDHVVYRGGYVVLPNGAVNDARLSLRARGLLAYMLAKPPNWSFNAERISRETVEGRDAIRAATRELVRCGYYRATKVQTHLGFRTVTEVAALPELMPASPGGGFPGAGNPTPGNPTPGKAAPVVSTESQDRESVRSAEVDLVTEAAR